jgi:tetratricopeptide (TPR) repeat protein
LTALKALLRQAQQRAEPAHSLARQAIDEAEAAADDAALARAYLVSDWANRVLGISEAAAFGELALAIYERNGDLDGAGKASNNLGGIAYFNGHWGEAERWYRKALDAYRRCGNEASAAVAGGNLAELLISQRAFGEADQMLRDSIRVLRSVRALDDVLFAEIQLGRLMSERGAPEAAIDHLARLRAEALAVGQVGYAFEAALHLASAQIALDRHDDAIATIDAASAGVGPIDVVYQPWLALVRARATIGNGRTTEARAMIESGLAIAREQSLVYDEASLLEVAIALDERGGGDPDPKAIERLAEIKQGLDTRLSDTR